MKRARRTKRAQKRPKAKRHLEEEEEEEEEMVEEPSQEENSESEAEEFEEDEEDEEEEDDDEGVPAIAHDMESLRRIVEHEARKEARRKKKQQKEKGKEQQEEEDAAGEDQEGAAEAEESREEPPQSKTEWAEQHIKELEELRHTDPKFFEYLRKNEPGLLDFSVGDVEEEVDENPDVEEEEDEEGAAKSPAKKRRKGDEDEDQDLTAMPSRSKVTVTTSMLEELERDCGKSVKALRKLLMIFKCACHIGDSTLPRDQNIKKRKNVKRGKGRDDSDDDDGDGDDARGRPPPVLPFKIPNSAVFNRVMTFCLSNMRTIVEDYLVQDRQKSGSEEEQAKKEEERKPLADTELGAMLRRSNRRWAELAGPTRAFLGNAVHFVNQLTQDEMRVTTLQLMEQYAPLYAQFAGVSRALLNVLLDIWSSGNEQARLVAFSNVLQLAKACPLAFLDVCLRGAYLTYIRSFSKMSAASVPLARFMRNCLVELFGQNQATAYRIAFVYIRQLAVHLRTVVAHTARNGPRALQNWQFVNALRLWTDVLCAHARGADGAASMKQLVFPLAQVIGGALDFCLGASHAPMRFHLVRMMNDLTEACGYLVCPVAALLQCLDASELQRRAKGASQHPVDLECLVNVSKQDLGTAALQDALVRAFYEQMLRFLAIVSYSPAFPELAVPVLAFLRRHKKASRVPLLTQLLAALIEKTMHSVAWLNERRAPASVVPRQRARAAAFLDDERAQHTSPLDQAWQRFAEQKRHFEELQRAARAKEREQERRRAEREEQGDFSGDDGGGARDSDDDNEDIIDEEATLRRNTRRAKQASRDDDDSEEDDEEDDEYDEDGEGVDEDEEDALEEEIRRIKKEERGGKLAGAFGSGDDEEEEEEYTDPEADNDSDDD